MMLIRAVLVLMTIYKRLTHDHVFMLLAGSTDTTSVWLISTLVVAAVVACTAAAVTLAKVYFKHKYHLGYSTYTHEFTCVYHRYTYISIKALLVKFIVGIFSRHAFWKSNTVSPSGESTVGSMVTITDLQ